MLPKSNFFITYYIFLTDLYFIFDAFFASTYLPLGALEYWGIQTGSSPWKFSYWLHMSIGPFDKDHPSSYRLKYQDRATMILPR